MTSRVVLLLSTFAAIAIVLTGVALILGKAAPLAERPRPTLAPPIVQPSSPPSTPPAYAQPRSQRPFSESSSGIFRCTIGGQTVYRDRPCAGGVEVDTSGAAVTYQTPRYVPTPVERIAERPHAAPVSPTARADSVARDRECEYIRAEIDRLDAQARVGGTIAQMDWIRAERRKVEDRRYELRC
jgi:hypothetical protein